MKKPAGKDLSPTAKRALRKAKATATQPKEGRRTSRPEHTDLHALLVKVCPPDGKKPGSIKKTLAPALGVSYQFIYRWIERNKIPPKYVNLLVNASKGSITQADVLPFVI